MTCYVLPHVCGSVPWPMWGLAPLYQGLLNVLGKSQWMSEDRLQIWSPIPFGDDFPWSHWLLWSRTNVVDCLRNVSWRKRYTCWNMHVHIFSIYIYMYYVYIKYILLYTNSHIHLHQERYKCLNLWVSLSVSVTCVQISIIDIPTSDLKLSMAIS